jgi:hypothetical protein
MSHASRVDCRKFGIVAASVVGLGSLTPASHAEDSVLAETALEQAAAELDASARLALDRMVGRIRAIAPELVGFTGWFRDEQPEIVEVCGADEPADAIKAYLVAKGVDPYRVRIEETARGRAPDPRRTTVRLVTFPDQKSFGSSGKAGLRFSR